MAADHSRSREGLQAPPQEICIAVPFTGARKILDTQRRERETEASETGRRFSIVTAMQRFALVSLLAAGLVMGGTTGEVAHAKGKKKAVVQAFVDGKKFKNSKRTPPSATYQTLTHLLIIAAGSQKGGARSVSIKSLAFDAQVDLATAVLPIAVSSVPGGMYSDNTYRGIPSGAPKSWVDTEGGLTITITKYDGVRIAGTFEGSMAPGSGVTAPATFTGGKFDLPIVVQ
jgi:hypothetical protein